MPTGTNGLRNGFTILKLCCPVRTELEPRSSGFNAVPSTTVSWPSSLIRRRLVGGSGSSFLIEGGEAWGGFRINGGRKGLKGIL